MISSLRGVLLSISPPDLLVIEVGGVGFKVFVPSSVIDSLDGIGRTVSLHTHLAVREDALTLYGFATEEQRALFELLLGVSGVGPKSAMAIISTLSPDVLRRAVANEQAEIFSRVPGVGKKTGEKIIFHLKDKIGREAALGAITAMSERDTEVIAALTALGYSIVESQAALQSIPKDAPDDVEERVRLALRYFATP